ncbi:MAG TPA: hypothetical protein V6D47_08945 [Oscillatoriaceae cyanobacterium]
MRPVWHPASETAEAAAFALFDGLRRTHMLDVTRRGEFLLSYARRVNPASMGLAFTNAEDDGLQLRWEEAPPGFYENLWVDARSEDAAPYMALYLNRERPCLQLRFNPGAFSAEDETHYVLRERLTIPSSGGDADAREAQVRRLAQRWRVPFERGCFEIGRWDALEGQWDPDAVRRLVAIALLLEAAREHAPDWLEV